MSDSAISDGQNRNLVSSLAATARTQARVALEARTDKHVAGSAIRAAIAAGVGLELALKAALASTLPSLLAANGDIHSQLHLMGHGGLPGKSPSDVRTIGGYEAARAFGALKPKVRLSTADVKCVLDVRNGAAHLGVVDDTELDQSIRTMAVCIGMLLPEIGIEPTRFWGAEFADQAAALAKEVTDLREIRVEQARSTALMRLARLQALGPDAFEAVAETLDANGLDPLLADEDYRTPSACPVCKRYGWLSGVVERSELQTDEEHSVWVERVFVPTQFECDLCGFIVDGGDLATAGFADAIDLDPDDDPWELHQLHEDALADEAFERLREDRLDYR